MIQLVITHPLYVAIAGGAVLAAIFVAIEMRHIDRTVVGTLPPHEELRLSVIALERSRQNCPALPPDLHISTDRSARIGHLVLAAEHDGPPEVMAWLARSTCALVMHHNSVVRAARDDKLEGILVSMRGQTH